jgi:hypothetical protein
MKLETSARNYFAGKALGEWGGLPWRNGTNL